MTSSARAQPQVISLGCRLNAAEADEMRAHALAAGLADAVIVNTCAVTGEAVRQGAQQIRRLRRHGPHARLVVTGCAAQTEPERIAAMAEVDHVIGNAEKLRPETFALLARQGRHAPRVLVGDIMAAREAAGPLVAPQAARPRAFVQIQNGCDHRCTFCVIPYGRGRSRSVPAGEVVARVRRQVDAGVPEAVLTGVDITSWGADLPGQPRLGELVGRVLDEVPGLTRLRLSSLDQAEVDDELLARIAAEPRLMPHLHLSLQSGDDIILKRMRRRHSRADAVRLCARLRRLRPDIALGADLIAGFPTETEVQFRDTLSAVDDCGLAFLHVFPYSPRQGTPAARMPQLAAAVVAERAARLREKGLAVLGDWLAGHIGRRCEASLERSGGPELPARTGQFAKVQVSGVPEGLRAGDAMMVHVTDHDGRQLLAEAVR